MPRPFRKTWALRGFPLKRRCSTPGRRCCAPGDDSIQKGFSVAAAARVEIILSKLELALML